MLYERLENLGYNPGGFNLSKSKLKEIIELMQYDKISIKKIKKSIRGIKNTLKKGDVQMAKVVSYEPLIIAIYSDEFDSVLMLRFPEKLIDKYDLSKSQKMICVNSYWPKLSFAIEDDIIPGDYCSNNFRDIIPFIPLFLTDNVEKCEEATKIFSDKHWNYFEQLIKEYQEKKPNQYRDGFKTLIEYWR